jgi:hypothetical protein
LGLSVKPYALKGKSAGIAYRRYEKTRPNIQWHLDLKQTKLADETTVYIGSLGISVGGSIYSGIGSPIKSGK